MGIQTKCDTTKPRQTIGKLERTQTSLYTNLKLNSLELQRQWHKYLQVALLIYNTTYHTTPDCAPSRISLGRLPYNILDHKLNPNPKETLPTKKNIMQSCLKYKENYDRKARASPLQQNYYCFILQPISDHQGAKIQFC